MSEDDDDILQDFLVEAGEILEQLSEQLVQLERSPDDAGLLNAIFRGFHTVKGGAGFLQFDAMVDTCHIAENVFDTLRKGKCSVTPELMDTVLTTVDVVHTMFDQIRAGKSLAPVDRTLIDALAAFANGDISKSSSNAEATSLQPAVDSPQVKVHDQSDLTDKQMSGSDDELMTDDEFEALLDSLEADKTSKAEHEAFSGEGFLPDTPVVQQLIDEVLPAGEQADLLATGTNPASRETVGTTVRVDTKRLDDIMNMVGELVLVRNRLVRLGLNSGNEEIGKAVANLDVVTADLQTSVMKTRMQPIKKVFGRFPRVVRDLARSLQKETNLELVGEETDLDKNLVEALADPLVHLVRNSVDHGIESPEEREACGKSRVGTIILSAEQEGDHILLSIQDDGRGMDPDVIRESAVSKGAIDRDTADRLNDSECFNLIFAPGFSTRDEISDVSGRGVGMDVVKTKITRLNGSVDVESTLGVGTRIVIRVPLTLAIMPTLMVMLQDQTFALPLVCVNEIFHLDLSKTNVVDGQEVIIVRNKAIPLYYLRNWLVRWKEGQPANDITDSHVVIVSAGNHRVGFVVDQLIGQEEVVIKPLGKMLHGTAGMAGATITGDGRIALILDVPGMLKRYG